MKNNIKKHAFEIFNRFKSSKISLDDLSKAEDKSKNLGGLMDDFKMFIAMSRESINGTYKINKWNLSIIIATIVYVISPIDAIPDFIPIIGWLDDSTIIAYSISKLADEINRYKNFKAAQ